MSFQLILLIALAVGIYIARESIAGFVNKLRFGELEDNETFVAVLDQPQTKLANLDKLKHVRVPKILSDSILQSWSCHLPNLSDKRKDFFEFVVEEFNKKKTGLGIALTTLGGYDKKGDFLVAKFAGFYCVIGADILGTDLIASWNLCDPKRIKENKEALESKINIRIIRFFTPKSELIKDIEIRSFASITEDVANQAVDRLVVGTDIDKSKLNRKSSGTLGPL